MTDISKRALLVSGAGGQLGRRVVERLLDARIGPLLAATRDPSKLRDLAARGVGVRYADFDEPGSLPAAFAGVERLLLISTDTLFPEGARLRQHRAAVAAAVQAGVRHVVYTSAPAPYPAAGGSLLDDHFWTEQALAASPLEWTILRNHLYTDFLLTSLPSAIASGRLASSAGLRGTSYVTRDDCARTAAAALAGNWNGRRVLDVTGPAPVTQHALAALAADLSGRPVEFVGVPPEAHRSLLAHANVPPFVIDALLAFDAAAAQGYHAIVTPTVRNLTGKEPTSVAEFLCAYRAALDPQVRPTSSASSRRTR